MSFPWPIPDAAAPDIYRFSPRFFTNRGIRLLLLDVDNTIAPYGDNTVPPRLAEWANGIRQAGIEIYILSNNRGDRPSIFAEQLGCGWVGRAAKPGTKALLAVLQEKAVEPGQAALIGDQIYTDVLCARRAGILALLVQPIRLQNPLLALRYGLEVPFRAAYRWRSTKI